MKYIFENTVISYNEGSIRKNGKSIFETNFADFGVRADDKGNCYILCQNNKSAIYLISISGESVNKKCLLESKNETGYEKSFCIEYVNRWINGVYVIKHEEKYLLIHHIVNSDITPFVVDSFDEETKVFLFKDYEDNLYVLYNNEKTGYKKYDWKSKKWSSFTTLCEEKGRLIFADGDFTSSPVFAFSLKDENGVFVFCEEKIISSLPEEVKPVVVNYRRELTILFEYQGRILKSVKEEKFSRPKYAYFGTLSKYELVCHIKDTFKKATYAAFTQRGTYRPLILNEAVQKEEIKEPKPMNEEESAVKKYDEIIKLLENKSEFEILSAMMKKLEAIEKRLEEINCGNTYKK